MIVNWEKYSKNTLNETKNSNKSKKSNKAYSDSLSQPLGLTCEDILNKEIEDDREREDSITSSTSILYPFKPKNQMNLIEANISEIYPLEICNNNQKELSLLSQINELSLNGLNTNNINTCNDNNEHNTIDYPLSFFSTMINDPKSFVSLMKQFNPNEFIKTYRNDIIAHSHLIIFNSYAHVLLIQVFPYFNQSDKEFFYKKVIKENLNMIINDDYGVEVLTNFIVWILNDDNNSMLLDILSYIRDNFIMIIQNANGNKLINALISQKNTIIMNILNDSVINNTVTLCLTYNTLGVVKYFIQFSPWSNQMIDTILTHINILSVHPYGHLVIQYLLNLNIDTISSIIINHFASDFIHYSNDLHSYSIIELIISKSNKPFLLPLLNTFSSTGMINQLLLTENGRRVLMLLNEYLPFMTEEYFLSQCNSFQIN